MSVTAAALHVPHFCTLSSLLWCAGRITSAAVALHRMCVQMLCMSVHARSFFVMFFVYRRCLCKCKYILSSFLRCAACLISAAAAVCPSPHVCGCCGAPVASCPELLRCAVYMCACECVSMRVCVFRCCASASMCACECVCMCCACVHVYICVHAGVCAGAVHVY